MRSVVLDSYAVLSFLFKEPGHETILTLFEKAVEANKKLFIASPNWGEIRYIVERKVGFIKWKEVKTKLLGLPIEIIDADLELAELAGEIKVSHKMSFADCFAAALAKHKKAEIYTGDPEFIEMEAEIKVKWL